MTPAPQKTILDYLVPNPNLPPNLLMISTKFYELAMELDALLPGSAEKTTAFRKLLEGKDCAVRAAL